MNRTSHANLGLPVDNIIAPTVDNEIVRLGRREDVPQTTPRKNTPELIAAARLSKGVLQFGLKEVGFPELREQLAFDLVATGTCTLKSWWDERIDDMIRIG